MALPHGHGLRRLLTGAADLRRAAAAPVAHDGHHPRAEAGAPLLAPAAHRAERRVRLAAVGALLGVDLPAHAGALQHVAAHRSHLPTRERRQRVRPVSGGRTGSVTVAVRVLYLHENSMLGKK